MKLGEEHYKWRTGDFTPLLVGDYEYLHLINDKSGFIKKKADVKRYPTIPQFKIFVSSPIEGYEDERNVALEVIKHVLEQEPIMQERFCREGKPSVDVCLEHVRKSDLLILILKDKADSLHKGKPICRLEYEEARRNKIETLVFLSDDEKREDVLNEWIKEIEDFEEGVFRGPKFTDLDDLKKQLITHITKSYPKIAEAKKSKESKGNLPSKILPSVSYDVKSGKIYFTEQIKNEKSKEKQMEYIYDTRFILHNYSGVGSKTYVNLNLKVNGKSVELHPLYSGKQVWPLQPYKGINGHFTLQQILQKAGKTIEQMKEKRRTTKDWKKQLTMDLEVKTLKPDSTWLINPTTHWSYDFEEEMWFSRDYNYHQ